ncbi:hypothetical protein B0A55_08428 [Friedmanniomyces simplex]|uniref:Heterokaryon incompatibility domain-containing protein n=1 Tax=Friedmanniomyces simplex TaxID=329884 RepID=A0A4U0X015_9PEZI|nr:hypothetical protein B0A55_08428 [Friedmanniomyces simplex]
MANVEYSHSFTYGVETSYYQPGFTVTQGSWTRETTDRVLPTAQQYGKDDWHSFIYEPFPDDFRGTRVLRLEPGSFLDTLRGSLTLCTLAEDGPSIPYVALSYVWGQPSDRGGIIINGRSVGIPTNLGRALRQIRSEEVAVTVWADAICINQHDIEERSRQVAIMLEVYSAATSVFAWLGPETENTAVGMQVLRHMLEAEPGAGQTPWELLPADLLKAGVADITYRDYFKRMWVVQEAAVAAEVVLVCGSHSISWRNRPGIVRRFERSVKLAGISPEWHEMGLPDLEGLLQLLQLQLDTGPEAKSFERPRSSLGLLDIVYELRHRRVADPRDRYYALIGVTGRGDAAALTPDYSLSVEEVYGQVIKLVMREEFPRAAVSAQGTGSSLTNGNEDTVEIGRLTPEDVAVTHTSTSSSNTKRSLEPDSTSSGVRRVDRPTQNGLSNSNQAEGVIANTQGVAKAGVVLDQRTILISHLEATCSRAKALIASGNMRRAATMLTVLAQGVENCAEE